VPPERFYGKSVRTKYQPNLAWLYTHAACNSAFRSDEEYFVASFAGHANSETGLSVFEDLRRAGARGHSLGLLKKVSDQFGKVFLADGSMTFNYDTDRSGRIVWKLVRGIYFEEIRRPLPEWQPKRLFLLGPTEFKTAAEHHPWFTLVRDTEPMGTHGAVFDYKWLSTVFDGIRGNALAMALWDRLLMLVLFHDPACVCNQCEEARAQN
jgi:hypothetical protein